MLRTAVLRDATIPLELDNWAYSGRGAIAQDGCKSSQHAQRWRDRAVRQDFRARSNGGLIVTASAATIVHRDLIISLAARHKLPAVYWEGFFVAAGGLISLGLSVDHIGSAAGYVDRILKGEKPVTCQCRRRPSTNW